MEILSRKLHPCEKRSIKIMQFGEGNFLRAFVDDIIQHMNDSKVISSDVVVVQPLAVGRINDLKSQDGLYTLILEGMENGKPVSEHRIIDVLGDFINPYTEYNRFLDYAKSEELKVIISNTTEAGISLDSGDTVFATCPRTFPGKLLSFLLTRYKHFKGDFNYGLSIIPCELIDNNGSELKKVLSELAKIKNCEENFINWLLNANHFTDTLVDRIVPGYPKDQIKDIQQKTGYIDNNVVKGEFFHLWVLKTNESIRLHFPADKCGQNVIFAEDIKPYKERKVKILNGTHTALVPVAYLCGIETVRESVENLLIRKFLQNLIYEEICPTVKLPKEQTDAFANSVLERFLNPYVRHELMSIALNSTTKFRTRLLQTLTDYVSIKKVLPKSLLFSFSALILFHKGKRGQEDIKLNDSPEILTKWKAVWEKKTTAESLVREVASWEELWGMDLREISSDFVSTVSRNLESMEKLGMEEALKVFLKNR